jgi:mono/diheme cytochrome c family protein
MGTLPGTWKQDHDALIAGRDRWDVRGDFANARLHVEYLRPVAEASAKVMLGNGQTVPLDGAAGEWQTVDIASEQLPGQSGLVRVWRDGEEVSRVEIPVRATDKARGARFVSTTEKARKELRFDSDFTLVARFRTSAGGTLAAMAPAEGKWAPDAKALFIRDGRLVYDIGWLGALSDGPKVNDGAWHVAAVVMRGGIATLHFDGKAIGSREKFTRPDVATHLFKIGSASPDFGGDFVGEIAPVRFYRRALEAAEIAMLSGADPDKANTPDFEWKPGAGLLAEAPALSIAASAGVRFRNVWTQPLDRTDHAALIGAWDDTSLARGRDIYAQLCVVCHGTLDAPGSLPTALRFGEGPFKNGSDPRSMFETLTKGFGQMVAQPQYTARQKYDVVHYIRETFLRRNPAQFVAVDALYLARLPRGFATAEAEREVARVPKYQQMDFGSALFWTLQVEEGNIAYKGIAIRLDDGPGGVSKGRAWLLYDHDTMRVATAWSGDQFMDWKGIAFDGSHQTHTSIVGEKAFANPVGPGWANPDTGSWEDPRLRGRDGRPYGPLPREWMHYRGLYESGSRVVVSYTIGDTEVLDSPGLIPYGSATIFVRTLNLGPTRKPLTLRVAPDDPALAVTLRGEGARLERRDGFVLLQIPAQDASRHFRIYLTRLDAANLAALQKTDTIPLDLAPLTRGGAPRWAHEVVTKVAPGLESGAFAVDTLTLPDVNPWNAWMRTSGFDFYPDGKSAAVCTWNGDVWRVDGVNGTGDLLWHRLASGLFQPLGVKFRNGELFICCRDQIARLRDLNGDGETDFIENFNNDHQVTEHFHEFAMGLQTDDAGNFYYAKSARHALPALVPHHGTLLCVSADGTRTDILATGFRAANGVCLNPDGTFFVTDQEGHWTPKNRINHVMPGGGFYGNLFGYTKVTDTADSAMRQPLVWITNTKDRSPAELLWVPKNKWGALGGSLLNLSYGYGRIYVVPHETIGNQMQGGVCELPIADLPTGVMRGRFHADGALYVCGMVGWATNCQQDGGFYRIRYTDKSAHLPIAIHARTGEITLTFTDSLDANTTATSFTAKAWSLKRSANYGSAHLNEHPVAIESARLSADHRSVTLAIPQLAPTHCMEIAWKLRDATGTNFAGNIHHTIHALGEAAR